MFSKSQRCQWAFFTIKKTKFWQEFCPFLQFSPQEFHSDPQIWFPVAPVHRGSSVAWQEPMFLYCGSTTSQQGWAIPAEYCRHLRLPTQVLRCCQESSLGSRWNSQGKIQQTQESPGRFQPEWLIFLGWQLISTSAMYVYYRRTWFK